MTKTIVEFINDTQIKVVTSRGEELIGHLTLMTASSNETKDEVVKAVKFCFDNSESCAQAMGSVPNLVINSAPTLLMGVVFEFKISPIEAQRRRVGSRIRELREEKGMSARELAFHCHIDPSNLSKIEQGKHAAGLDILNRIAYFLDAEVQINFKPVDENNRPSKYVRIRDTMQ